MTLTFKGSIAWRIGMTKQAVSCVPIIDGVR